MILKPSGVYCDGKKGFRSIELLISEISGFANLLSFRGQSFERFRRPHGPPYHSLWPDGRNDVLRRPGGETTVTVFPIKWKFDKMEP